MIDNATNRLKVKRGTDLPQSKLTDEDVRLARQLHEYKQAEIKRLNETLSIKALAEKFDVSERAMERALNRANWGHVQE